MSEVYSVIGLWCQWFTVSGVFRSLVYNIIGLQCISLQCQRFTVSVVSNISVYSVRG